MHTVAELTERQLVARIQSFLPPPPEWVIVGIGDDGAVVEAERNRVQVLTVDMLIEGVHFDRRFTPPAAIGHRALAANLSDLAAMGAAPRAGVLSLGLPPDLPASDLDEMISGLADLAARHHLHIVGGNLTRSTGPLIVDLTLTGTAKRRQVLRRTGARAGDVLYVSGSAGGATAGLEGLRESADAGSAAPAALDACVRLYRFPEPRIRLGQLLARNRAASACMDSSDGLADAVRQVAEASGVGAEIDGDAVPVHPEARSWFDARGRDPVLAAMSGGDDYELLFAVSPRAHGRLRNVAKHAGVPLTRIGVCTADRTLALHRLSGPSADGSLPPGYAHFR
jgi:thiamine-monophosphate kinase